LEIPQHKISRKTNNKMEGRRPKGCITDSRNTRLEETTWGQKMKAPFMGGQRPEGAVAPNRDKMEGWLDGSKCKLFANNFNKNKQFWAEPIQSAVNTARLE